MTEHLEGVEISAIDIDTIPEVQGGYAVGRNGVTWIEAFTKSGQYAPIPYVRVWKGHHPLAEFCQHNIVGVYFKEPDPAPTDGGLHCQNCGATDGGGCGSCPPAADAR